MRNLNKTTAKAKIIKLPPKKLTLRTAKKGKKQSRRGSQSKSKFLAKMSYDLRTPLNAIIGFSEMISKGKAGSVNREQREYLNDILDSAKDLLRFIKNAAGLSNSAPLKKLNKKRKKLPKKQTKRS